MSVSTIETLCAHVSEKIKYWYFNFRQCVKRQQTTDLNFHQTNADILAKIRKRRESSADITVVRKESEHRTTLQSDIAR